MSDPTSSTVLVTGALGFVGARLVRELRARGHSVIASRADVRRASEIRAVVDTHSVGVVFHAAAVTSGSADEIRDVNVRGTGNVLAAGARRVVFLSSGAVYGTPSPCPEAVDESAPLLGASAYASSKLAAEARCRDDGSAVIVRLGSLYGPTEAPGPHRPFVSMPRRLADAVRSGSAAVHGTSVPRTYCHVDDAVHVIVELGLAPSPRWDTYNVDALERTTLADWIDGARVRYPAFTVTDAPSKEEATLAMTTEDERPRLDTSRLRAELGTFQPRSLERGLKSLLD